jgi:hypothetical protein
MQLQHKFQKMLNNPVTQTIDLGDGRTITIESGKLGKQSDGSESGMSAFLKIAGILLLVGAGIY